MSSSIMTTPAPICPLLSHSIFARNASLFFLELPKTDLKHGLIGFSVVLICLTFGKIRLNHVSDPFWGALVLPHPPYSPDIAPCDFWLFGRVKDIIAKRNILSLEELKMAVDDVLSNLDIEEYQNSFKSWIKRMRLCVELVGGYVHQR